MRSVRFTYYDFGEFAQDLDQVMSSDPEVIARKIELVDTIEEAIEFEVGEEIDEVVALKVHTIEAAPGGLMGIEYTYDLEAWWEPWVENPDLPTPAAFLRAADESIHADWGGRAFVGRDDMVADVLARLGMSECAVAGEQAEAALNAVAGSVESPQGRRK